MVFMDRSVFRPSRLCYRINCSFTTLHVMYLVDAQALTEWFLYMTVFVLFTTDAVFATGY